MFTIQERKQSGAGDYGKDSSYEKSWIVSGTAADNASDAATMIVWACGQGAGYGNIPQLIQIPGTILIGYLTRLRYDNVSGNLMTWRVDGTYTSPTEWRTTGDHAFSFNTAGGTKKIKHVLSHVQSYYLEPSNGTPTTGATQFDSALNPSLNGDVEGVEVDSQAFDFQHVLTLSPAQVTASYINLLKTLTDSVCGSSLNFTIDGVVYSSSMGESRFKGATGMKRTFGDFEITLNFSHKPNHTSDDPIVIGPFTNVICNGQDYISVVSTLAADETVMTTTPTPIAVLFDQIYPYLNWSGLIPGIL